MIKQLWQYKDGKKNKSQLPLDYPFEYLTSK